MWRVSIPCRQIRLCKPRSEWQPFVRATRRSRVGTAEASTPRARANGGSPGRLRPTPAVPASRVVMRFEDVNPLPPPWECGTPDPVYSSPTGAWGRAPAETTRNTLRTIGQGDGTVSHPISSVLTPHPGDRLLCGFHFFMRVLDSAFIGTERRMS
jgi:hypothetical protein